MARVNDWAHHRNRPSLKRVKQLTYAEATWLVGDDAASAIIDYVVALGRANSADSIEFSAITSDGHSEKVTFVIGPATMMTAESTEASYDEPENSEAVATIRQRIARIQHPTPVPSNDRPQNDQIEDL